MNTEKVFVLAAVLLTTMFAHSETLLKTTSTWEGGKIVYPAGDAEVTSIKLKLAEGEVTPFHCHPVPTLGYILHGNVEVETSDGKITVLREGQSAVEVLRTVHRGKALGGPVEIIVFYAGSTAIPNVVLPENDPEFIHCNR